MKNKKIGFWGGCFNPPSCAHIDLAVNMLQDLNLDKIFFVPVGDYYEKNGLENSAHRYNMLKIATDKIDNLEVEDIELKTTEKLYAKDAFKILNEKYNESDNYFIMGSDNFLKMPTWKEYESIIEKYKYIIVKRPNFNVNINIKNIIYYEPNQTKNISSTIIRKSLKEKNYIEGYIERDVYNYILENKLYNI